MDSDSEFLADCHQADCDKYQYCQYLATKMMIATRFVPSPVEQSYRSTYALIDRTNR